MEELISTFNIVSFIAAIVSVVLSIVAIVFTILFYWLSKKESETISTRAQTIETQTELLRVLFDTMLNTSITMIKENSDAMHKYMMATVGQTSVSPEKSGESLEAQGQVAKKESDSSMSESLAYDKNRII